MPQEVKALLGNERFLNTVSSFAEAHTGVTQEVAGREGI